MLFVTELLQSLGNSHANERKYRSEQRKIDKTLALGSGGHGLQIVAVNERKSEQAFALPADKYRALTMPSVPNPQPQF